MSRQEQPPDADNFVSREEYNRVLQENALMRSVIDRLPSELVVLDADLRFMIINKAAIKDDEMRTWMIGKTNSDFWQRRNPSSPLSSKRKEDCEEAIGRKGDYGVEETFHEGTASEKHYMRLHRPEFSGEDLKYILVYGQDITVLKKSEVRLLTQNAELEKVNHELDQFVYSASHNLRAPLLSITGLLGLIELSETEAAARKRFIGEIHKSIDRLDGTIKDIIDYSKNARLALIPEPTDIEQYVYTAHNDLRFIEETSVELEVSHESSCEFYTDTRRFKSIVHNIISNSVKYSDPAKGRSWLKVNIQVNAERCRMEFIDNGRGILEENQGRVFEMFYRGTAYHTGSGLGLYIAKEMTERIGGTIELQSIPLVGTTISISLPNLIPNPQESVNGQTA